VAGGAPGLGYSENSAFKLHLPPEVICRV